MPSETASSNFASIVIPTFNEQNVDRTLTTLSAALTEISHTTFEVLIVDDSAEELWNRLPALIAAAALPSNVSVRLLRGVGRGKGSAVRVGALASRGDIVFTMDADLPVSLHHIREFLMHLRSGEYDAVIAERPFKHNAREPLRFVLSRGLYAMQRFFVFQSNIFMDTQCGFKAFEGSLVRSLASRQVVDGGMYDIEYLYIASLERKRVLRVRATSTENVRASKIRVWRALRKDPADLVRIKVRGVLGTYLRRARGAGAPPAA